MSRGPVLTVTLTADDNMKGGLSSSEASVQGWGSKMSGFAVGVGAAFTTMAVDIVSDIAGMVAGAVTELAAAPAQFQALLGATQEEAGRYTEIAAGIYRDAWGGSLAEVNEAVAVTTQNIAGLNGQELEDVTTWALGLSDVFGVDVAESTRVVDQMLRNGLISTAEEGFDILTAGFQDGNNRAGDFLDTINEYSEQFSSLGIDGAGATAIIAAGLDAGAFSADKVGDAIKEFSIRAIDGSETTRDAYEAIGMDADETARIIAEGGPAAEQAFGDVVDAIMSIEDPLEREAAGVALFGSTWEDLGEGVIGAMADSTDAVEDFSGSAQELADAAGSNWTAKFESFKRKALGGMADFIIEKVIPAVERLVAWFQKNWPKIKAAVEPVLRWFEDTINDVVTVVLALWDAFGSNILRYAEDAWNNVKDVIEGVILVIKGIIDTVLGVLTGDWKKAWDGIKSIVSGVWLAIRGIVNQALNIIRTVISGAWTIIKSLTTAAWNGIKSAMISVITSIVEWVRGVPGRLSNAVGSLASTLYQKGKDFLNGLWNGMKNVALFAGVWMMGLPGRLMSALGSLGSILYNAGKDILNGLWNGMKDQWNSMTGWVGSLAGRIRNLFGGMKQGWGEVEGFLGGLAPSLAIGGDALQTTTARGSSSNMSITQNFPAGVRSADVVNAQRNYRRIQGTL